MNIEDFINVQRRCPEAPPGAADLPSDRHDEAASLKMAGVAEATVTSLMRSLTDTRERPPTKR